VFTLDEETLRGIQPEGAELVKGLVRLALGHLVKFLRIT
jgi:hypothetical protein